ALIQGPEGSQVTITILRGVETMTLTMTRAQIQVPTVRTATVGNHVLYARIYQFASNTSSEFSTALKSGLPGSVGMVLDLRGDRDRRRIAAGAQARQAGGDDHLRQGIGAGGFSTQLRFGPPSDGRAVVSTQRPDHRSQGAHAGCERQVGQPC